MICLYIEFAYREQEADFYGPLFANLARMSFPLKILNNLYIKISSHKLAEYFGY